MTHFHSWIQSPCCVAPVEVDNRSEVVKQGNVDVQTTSNEPTCVEQVMIPFLPRLRLHLLGQTIARLGEPAVLVDGGQLFNHVIVESVEQDKENTAAWWESKQSLFGEAIWLQLAICECSDSVLVLLRVTI